MHFGVQGVRARFVYVCPKCVFLFVHCVPNRQGPDCQDRVLQHKNSSGLQRHASRQRSIKTRVLTGPPGAVGHGSPAAPSRSARHVTPKYLPARVRAPGASISQRGGPALPVPYRRMPCRSLQRLRIALSPTVLPARAARCYPASSPHSLAYIN